MTDRLVRLSDVVALADRDNVGVYNREAFILAVSALPSVPVATVGVTREDLASALVEILVHKYRGDGSYDCLSVADAILALLKPVVVDVEAAARELRAVNYGRDMASGIEEQDRIDATRILRAAGIEEAK